MRPERERALPVLLVLFVLALVLRWPIALHDVEHYIGPDEGEVVENVLEILKTGDPDHRHPGYPGLHFYIQLVPAAGHLWLARGGGAAVPDLPRSGFYLVARRVTLVAGLASALVVFGAGRRVYGPWLSLLAATLVLLSPLAFRESAVVSPDLMLMFFVAVSLGLSLRLLRRRDRASALLAGAGVGLATAVKYTGAFTAVAFALAWVLGSRGEEGARAPTSAWSRGLLGASAALVAFAIASPYTLLDLSGLVRGLATHAAYYRAAETNAALEVLEVLVRRGLGPVAAVAALVGSAKALASRERSGIVLLGFVSAYVVVFAFFDRAFPRHALALLPATALLGASGVGAVVGRPRRRSVVLAVSVSLVLLGPLAGMLSLVARVSRPTAAERAARWIEEHLPEGSRVLQDQFTPSLDPDRFRAHRLRVEERRFAGNYDWVLYSGYPPGLTTEGLREAARFEPAGALGDGVTIFQVPSRDALMGVTLPAEADEAVLGAGELAYFGEGFHPPRPGAFQTSRLSQGERSEIFFVLPRPGEPGALEATFRLAPARRGLAPGEIEVELNGRGLGSFRLDASSDEPDPRRVSLPAEALRAGLNRLALRYERLGRLDRRHPDTAIRLYEVRLSRSPT